MRLIKDFNNFQLYESKSIYSFDDLTRVYSDAAKKLQEVLAEEDTRGVVGRMFHKHKLPTVELVNKLDIDKKLINDFLVVSNKNRKRTHSREYAGDSPQWQITYDNELGIAMFRHFAGFSGYFLRK